MSILNIQTDFAGQVGVSPRIVRINTNDSFSTVITQNYLKSAVKQGYTFYPNDLVELTYSNNTTQMFTLSISGGNITLVPLTPGVTFPVTDNNFAVFDGTGGTLKDGGTPGEGAFKDVTDNTKALVASVNGATVIGNVAQFSDVTGTVQDAGIAANEVLFGIIANPDPSANLLAFDVTVNQGDLAAGGSVVLINSSGSKQYRLRSLFLNAPGINFSGGGGDRLGQVTDNTTVYSLIPAATMQSLVNAAWGSTELPFPAAATLAIATAAGASLVFKYSGGTTDYTAGSLVISGTAERIA
jgi:hypothetical protein